MPELRFSPVVAAFVAFVLATVFLSVAAGSRLAEEDDFVAVLTCRAGMEDRISAGRASREVRCFYITS